MRRASSMMNDDLNYEGVVYDESSSSYPRESESFLMTTMTDAENDTATTPAAINNRNRHSDKFTRDETKAVNIVKIVVYATLAFAALGVGMGSYFLIRAEQQEGFQTEFDAITDQVAKNVVNSITSVNIQLLEIRNTIASSLQQIITNDETSTITTNSSSLFVTIPYFDQRTQQQNNNSRSELFFYTPIVDSTNKQEWEEYASKNQWWIDQDLRYRGWNNSSSLANNQQIPNEIYSTTTSTTSQEQEKEETEKELYLPIWQLSPVPRDRSIVNLDVSTYPHFQKVVKTFMEDDHYFHDDEDDAILFEDSVQDLLIHLSGEQTEEEEEDKEYFSDISMSRSLLVLPIFNGFEADKALFGFVFSLLSWEQILYQAMEGIEENVIVSIVMEPSSEIRMEDACQKSIIHREPSESDLESAWMTFYERKYVIYPQCRYTLYIFPTKELKSKHLNAVPILCGVGLVILFCFLMAVFHQYDRIVQQRQQKLLLTAQRTQDVVSSLFPEDVQRRIMEEAEENEQTQGQQEEVYTRGSRTYDKMREFLEDEKNQGNNLLLRSKPIADFFPEATVMFADIVGFTAWSSMREPSHVFTLLESIYHAFDEVARRRRVFKVETVGDCYVAVAGLPEPCMDHALVMCRFASDCRFKMNDLVKVLEVSLGPDTTDLAMRFGLHSGPVTAGVLRGDKARFQLFGDTVNTTSRLESTGKRDKIHVSQETAEYLINSGREHWLTLRDDKVTAKGKGELTTYWLSIPKKQRRASFCPSTSTTSSNGTPDYLMSLKGEGNSLNDKQMRLVDWMTNELAFLLKDIERRRRGMDLSSIQTKGLSQLEKESLSVAKNPLDEVQEIIVLPKFDSSSSNLYSMDVTYEDIILPEVVTDELHDFVYSLAEMYQENPFHNFEHASHVTMSVVKLLSRIVAPNIRFVGEEAASELHDQTYGITSDPLTQFTVVLSALIHDVDHPGVPNTQLTKEQSSIASLYKNKSVAEQNSVDKTWRLLMEGDYQNLRQAIYRTEAEFKRFRHLLVNTVMATDIMDKELGAGRKARWNKAFSEKVEEDATTAVNRKATIVIEHIIQASDIAHTMQHWHIYRKWNGRLFAEMYKAFINGRAEKNPAENWYKGEIGFFDYYIIPLAKKLKECGVFGVSSDEYLNYAQQNRKEWELNGERVVENMIQSIRMETASKSLFKVNSKENLKKHPGTSSSPRRPSMNGSYTSMSSHVPVRRGRRPSMSSMSSLPGPSMSSMSSLPGPSMSSMSSLPDGVVEERKTVDPSKANMPESETSSTPELPVEMSILIVDDDKITRKLFSRSVKKIAPQWKIQDAGSGEEALEIVTNAAKPFDLIFMDQYMGTEADMLLGSDVVAELRNRGNESVICGMSANDVETLFDDAGADAFIFKPLPFRPDALTRELKRILVSGDGWENW